MSRMERRTFLKESARLGAGLVVLKSGILKAGAAPNDKLNIAVIGVGGRGAANLDGVKSENIVALCDVNENNLAEAAKRFPQAKTYTDWRRCLEQKDIDAVVCSTTDHTHAHISTWALNRGKHVYCEKPLANSVHEARTVREAYLKQQGKVATQMGTQIHASDNFRRVVELIQRGAIGTVSECHVWCTRLPRRLLPARRRPRARHPLGSVIGPRPSTQPGLPRRRPPEPVLILQRQIGDMGATCRPRLLGAGPGASPPPGRPPEVNPDTCPQWFTATWDHPATATRPAVKVFW